jgi:MinD-like ATPase involved in chromosome partitioning or flagellar assembly
VVDPAARSVVDPAGAVDHQEAIDSTLSRPIGPIRPPAPAVDYLEPLAQIVAPPSLAPRAAVRRLVRAVTFGLIEPGAAAVIEHERQLVARARWRRPEPRVIAFLAGKGGVGTSTTAAAVALTLATLRTDTTALVCARAGAGSLGERLYGQPAPPVPALVSGEPPPPLWVHGNLAVVDGAPWHSPTPGEPLVALLEQLRGQHPITIVDVGNDLGDSAKAAVERADQVVLVASASQDAISAVKVALSRVHQVDPFRLGTAVVALTCLNVRQYRRVLQRLRSELGVHGPRIVPIGFDPWLAAGARIEPARLRPATREAYLQIAGLVVEPGGHEQWFAQPAGAS